MDFLETVSEMRQLGLSSLEDKLLKDYRERQDDAVSLIEGFFKEANAMHLLRPHVGLSTKPQIRLFNALDLDERRLLNKEYEEYEIHYSKTWYEKSALFYGLKELSFNYITDFVRKYTERYVCVTTDFRPKVLRNFDCHMCSSWKHSGSAHDRMLRQLEFFKTFPISREESQMRHGLRRFVKGGKLDERNICSQPESCDFEADSLIVDHMENYMTLEQVMLLMQQHKAARAAGFILFPDCIDFKKKGNFYEGKLNFDRSKKKYGTIEEPVLFYDENKLFTDCIYPWVEYRKFFEKTQVIYKGQIYRYEIVNRTHGVLFYTLSHDGPYHESLSAPSYKLLHYDDCYEVKSLRPVNKVFGRNFSNFEWVSAYIPREIYAKVLKFASTLGPADFNRKTIQEHLCASFMRVGNSATGAVTQFDPGLSVDDVEIASDVIWSVSFMKRRQRAEIFASQKEINQEYGNVGLNFDTLRKYASVVMEAHNPFQILREWYENNKEIFYEKKWTEFLPHAIYHGPYKIISGTLNTLDMGLSFDFFNFNHQFVPKWYTLLHALKSKKDPNYDEKYKKLLAIKNSSNGVYHKITENPYYYFVERDRPIVDSIEFFTDEIVRIHDEPGFTEGDRESLLRRLNIVTDAMEPILTRVSVLKEVDWMDDYKEPMTFHPLVPLKDVVTSMRMAVSYITEDAPPLIDSRFDMYEMHYGDFNMSIEADLKFNTFNRKFIPPSSVMGTARVMSYITKCKNPPSYKNTFLAFNKRNWNIPILEEITDQLHKVDSTVENMFNCLCIPGWKDILEKEYSAYPMTHFYDKNASFVNHLIPGKAKRFNLDEMVPIGLWTDNKFTKHTNILKSDTKFSLAGDIQSEYTVNSTINFHDLEVNAQSSSIFRNVITRLKAILRPEVCMMIEKDRRGIEEFYFRNFEKNKYEQNTDGYLSLEIDYSKFDKSQKERCAMIEMYIYARLGLKQDFAEIWFESLKKMTTINYHDMIKCHLEWQRRTGTATTALGNTLVTMATVCAVLFPNFVENSIKAPFKCAAFVGDDSSIIVDKTMHIPSAISEKLNAWFNLSAKFDIKNHIYFCSSFIIFYLLNY